MNPCIPCPAPVRHFAHHIHHHVLRPIGRHVHHVWHHAPRVIAYGCCAAAVGGMGGALVAPPGGFFAPPAAAYAPAPSVYSAAPGGAGGYSGGGLGGSPGSYGGGSSGASQGWPETPAYSSEMGSGIIGGGAVMIPTYSNAHPELLSVQPNVYSAPPGITRISTHTTNVPEPSSFALLLLPLVTLPILRRMR